MAGIKRNKATLWRRIFDLLLVLLTLAAGMALLLAYFAPRVDPNNVVWFTFLGLAAPFLYLANLLLMLYWVIRWRRIAIFPLILLVIGLGDVGKYLKINLRQNYEADSLPDEAKLRVLTYNVDGFWGENQGQKANRLPEISAYIRDENPDILCMQEFEVNYINTAAEIDSMMGQLAYHKTYLPFEFDGGGWGLAIYSRYRILRSGNIPFEESNNSAMWADLMVGRDTVRVFNCHLQTTGVDETDKEALRPESNVSDSLRLDKSKGIARKLARNYRKRAGQADSLAIHIHTGFPLVIVCGDFNDTPMSYAYRKIRGDFDDAFQEKGRGMAYTYRGIRSLFRIDYVLHSRWFQTLDYRSEHLEWSDHNPVVVDLALRKE